MYAVLREDYFAEAHRLDRNPPASVGIVCATLPTLEDARALAEQGTREFGNARADNGTRHHYFTVHPAAVLRERLAVAGWEA